MWDNDYFDEEDDLLLLELIEDTKQLLPLLDGTTYKPMKLST